MMTIKFFVRVTLIVLLIQTAIAEVPNQSSKPIVLTLYDAIFLALRKNPTIENAELDRIIQKYSLVAVQNTFEPQYSLTGGLSYSQAKSDSDYSTSSSASVTPGVSIKNHYGTVFSITSTNPVSGQSYNPALSFQIQQPLIQGFGKAIVDKALNDALDNEEVNRLGLKYTFINTINSVISSYLSLFQQRETLKVDLSSLERYQQAVKNDQLRIDAGKMAATDMVQDQAQVARQLVTIENDRAAIETSRLALLTSLGLDPTANIKLPDKVDLTDIIRILTGRNNMPSLEVCKKIALANDPGYQAAGIQLRSLRRALVVAKNNMLWSLNLTASETRGGGSGNGDNSGLSSLTNGRNHAESVGLALTIPIDNVSSKQALIGAKVALDQAGNSYLYAKQTLESGITSTRNTVISSKASLELSKNAVELQRKTVEYARIKFNAGRISNFELLDKQKTLNDSEQTVVSNMINYLNTLATFNLKLGITLDLLGIKLKDSVQRT